MKQVDGVYNLILRNLKAEIDWFIFLLFRQNRKWRRTPEKEKSYQQVDHPEVLLQAVANEANFGVDEEAQLQVRGLERGQML